MWSHSLSVLITKTKKLLSNFTFALSFLFFSFFFSKSKHLIITMSSPSSCHDLYLLHHLEYATYLMITWWTRLALRVSSIHQNQTRAFTSPRKICGEAASNPWPDDSVRQLSPILHMWSSGRHIIPLLLNPNDQTPKEKKQEHIRWLKSDHWIGLRNSEIKHTRQFRQSNPTHQCFTIAPCLLEVVHGSPSMIRPGKVAKWSSDRRRNHPSTTRGGIARRLTM